MEQDGFALLLDLGTGAAGPLQRYTPAPAIDAAFITHAHGDHCDDLWSAIYLRAHAVGTPRLPVYGPPGVPGALPRPQTAAEYLSFEPVPEHIGPWAVRTAVTEHVIENWVVRLDDRLCYTGDSAPCRALDDVAHGCAVLLAEAAGLDADPTGATPHCWRRGSAGGPQRSPAARADPRAPVSRPAKDSG